MHESRGFLKFGIWREGGLNDFFIFFSEGGETGFK